MANNELIENQKYKHFEKFNKWLNEVEEGSTSTSKIIDQKRANEIIHHLRNPEAAIDPNLKYRIKKAQYNIIIENDEPVLCRLVKSKLGNQNLPVAINENFFDILYKIHSVQRSHVGIVKIEKQLSMRYYGNLIFFLINLTFFNLNKTKGLLAISSLNLSNSVQYVV